jgi:hypothetical protein
MNSRLFEKRLRALEEAYSMIQDARAQLSARMAPRQMHDAKPVRLSSKDRSRAYALLNRVAARVHQKIHAVGLVLGDNGRRGSR